MKYRWYYKIPLFGLLGILALIGLGYLVMFLMEPAHSCSLPWTRDYILAGSRPFRTGQDPAAYFRRIIIGPIIGTVVGIITGKHGWKKKWHP